LAPVRGQIARARDSNHCFNDRWLSLDRAPLSLTVVVDLPRVDAIETRTDALQAALIIFVLAVRRPRQLTAPDIMARFQPGMSGSTSPI
jgi:hypothetical protein